MNAPESSFTRFLDQLDREFLKLHTAKEDAFWASYMGTADDADAARRELDKREKALKRFLGDPQNLGRVREQIEVGQEAWNSDDDDVEVPGADEMSALDGWRRTFESHVVESREARALLEELVEDEGRLQRARGEMHLGYHDPGRGFVAASSVRLGLLISTSPDEQVRHAAFQALRGIETHVLANGFCELVRKRNRLGRLLGGEDFYDATVRRVERMTKEDVFELLDELEARTREAARESLDLLRVRKGSDATKPWNVRYAISGDVATEQDPYFPFEDALLRWGRSFSALRVDFKGADLVLDLVDRAGKYENGFMHGPVPAWREKGVHRPARIQFTANAIPGMIGSGRRAAETLFHEGGHAAHFANCDMPSPCFGQEFAPTSVAFSETQSMLLDSLLSDAAWQSRYARNLSNKAMPFALIEKGIVADQPFAAWSARSMLAVCYAEKAIYEIPDDELTPERVLMEIRAAEHRLLFLGEGGPRPTLSVPHLLAGESSAYYHGYVLAEMAVHQTRDFFLRRDGHLVDNPRLGPDLAETWWREGNRLGFQEFIQKLTRRPLSAEAMAAKLTHDVEDALALAKSDVDRIRKVPTDKGAIDLKARIRMVHGREVVAESNGGGFEEMARTYGDWVARIKAEE